MPLIFIRLSWSLRSEDARLARFFDIEIEMGDTRPAVGTTNVPGGKCLHPISSGFRSERVDFAPQHAGKFIVQRDRPKAPPAVRMPA